MRKKRNKGMVRISRKQNKGNVTTRVNPAHEQKMNKRDKVVYLKYNAVTTRHQDPTHNWLSRGMVGSIRSPRELQWSSEVILVLTRQPLECRCSGRVFPSLVGDIRDFSTPSNWTVIKENATVGTLYSGTIWWIF